MKFVVDADNLGTPESAWKTSGPLASLPPLEWSEPGRVVVVTPHPDDEVFGAGGLLQVAFDRGVPIEIFAVTDGEQSHRQPDFYLCAGRAVETREALGRLGLGRSTRRRLGIPDGMVASHVDALANVLAGSLHRDDLCVTPWMSDGHPNHDACGRAASTAAASSGARFLGFLVWAWHWAGPEGTGLPWDKCRRVDLSRRAAARKRWSIGSFASESRPPSSSPGELAALPPNVLRRFYRPFEVFVEEGR
jgi:LmbE family N-acetylglucosaminyl deacetylase